MSDRNLLLSITIPQFITHCLKRPLAKNKKPGSSSPYFKIGGNAFYSQSLNYFTRAFVVKELHKFISSYVPQKIKITDPVIIEILYYCPRNMGDVAIGRDKQTGEYKIRWKPYNKDYKSDWDIQNLDSIWSKVIIDELRGKIHNGIKVTEGILQDDSVDYVRRGEYEFIETPDINDRKIIINIYGYTPTRVV
jgi:hypothetical protein